MADSLNCRILLEITTKDGQPYHKTELNYVNLPYEYVVQIERVGANAISELVKLGEQQVATSVPPVPKP